MFQHPTTMAMSSIKSKLTQSLLLNYAWIILWPTWIVLWSRYWLVIIINGQLAVFPNHAKDNSGTEMYNVHWEIISSRRLQLQLWVGHTRKTFTVSRAKNHFLLHFVSFQCVVSVTRSALLKFSRYLQQRMSTMIVYFRTLCVCGNCGV